MKLQFYSKISFFVLVETAATLVSQSHVGGILHHEWLLKTFKSGNAKKIIDKKLWMLKIQHLYIENDKMS